MSLEDMGILNVGWGICGVTSSLYALHSHSPSVKHSALSSLATDKSKMAGEIGGYLAEVFAQGHPKLIAEIGAFTRTFKGYEGFSVVDYLRQAKVAASSSAVMGDFSIAMPPDSVVDYLKRRCGFRNPSVLWQSGKGMMPASSVGAAKELIIGVGIPEMKMYGGLCHYLYQAANGKIHSWGEIFNDIALAGAKVKLPAWTPCALISPTG
ncbi:hypothetical protein NZK35_23020 [Stieleria sp. ICT_E10.1]|uniref:hypothetical protein n=1 Tax=Stieleria sedimenti TaxID=2976331 RepID=UPI00217F4071|nr:hypothetical protein [Stieleria sedimenti]MCS7469535.1 hypothetical protein [Stieleria sedimenti]